MTDSTLAGRRRVRLRDVLLRIRSGRASRLLIARVVEQGCLGGVSLLLARWLGVEDYAPIALLLVFNSLAIVASDLGLGTMIMSGGDQVAGIDQVRKIRALNVGVVLLCGLAGVVLHGSLAAALPWIGAIWLASGESFIRKSCLLRLGREGLVAASEIAASLFLVAIAVMVAIVPGRAVLVVGSALLAKHVLEVLAARGWRNALGEHGTSRAGAVWWTQLGAYATANVDFLIIAVVVSPVAFSIYSLGFRLAALVTSQISYAFGRLILVDLARAKGLEDRQRVYDSRIRLLFRAGLVAMVITVAGAAMVPLLLGHEWADSAWVMVVLAIATPWRMALCVTGSLMVSGGRAPTLVRWEVLRLFATAAVLFAAAQGGLWPFAGAAAAVAIGATVVLNRAATSVSGLREWRWPRVLALPALVALVVSVQIAQGR